MRQYHGVAALVMEWRRALDTIEGSYPTDQDLAVTAIKGPGSLALECSKTFYAEDSVFVDFH